MPEFLQEQKQLTPDDLETGETVKTPRGTFHVTAMSREQIEAAGYGFHHQSDDGKYLIMGNGTRAFAVAAEQPEKVNPLKHIEDTVEQNDNNFDGIINNTPTVDELEAKVKELNEKCPKTMPLKISSGSGFIHIDQDTKTHNNGCDKPVAYFFIYRVKRIYRFSERPQIEKKGGAE